MGQRPASFRPASVGSGWQSPGRPFDNGLYEIALERFDAPDPKPELKREYVKTRRWPR